MSLRSKLTSKFLEMCFKESCIGSEADSFLILEVLTVRGELWNALLRPLSKPQNYSLEVQAGSIRHVDMLTVRISIEQFSSFDAIMMKLFSVLLKVLPLVGVHSSVKAGFSCTNRKRTTK